MFQREENPINEHQITDKSQNQDSIASFRLVNVKDQTWIERLKRDKIIKLFIKL